MTTAACRHLAVTFVNNAGNTLVKLCPLAHLASVASSGVGFSPVADAFAIDGTIDPLHPLARPDGDLRLVADAAALLPLESNAGLAWAPGDRRLRDGTPYPGDQRSFCRRSLEAAAADGLTCTAGFEIEWVVGPAVPGGPYGADRLIAGLDYLDALATALEAAGLPWLQLHPEYGEGQFELSLAPADPLTAADRLVAAKLLIQRVTARFGWALSFSPLLATDRVGNGGHLHISVARAGQPLLEGGQGPGGLPPEGEALVAGLLHHLPALLPLACPLAVSYLRLSPGRWSAPFQAWGVENREAALRLIPAGPDGGAGQLELKVADLAANPYLLVGAVVAVLTDGLARPRPLPPAVVGDPGHSDHAPPRLPASLEGASAAFAASDLLRDVLGEPLHAAVLGSQAAELRRAGRLDTEALVAASRWWPTEPPPG
ncbi:MAG: glutamine synthetase [Cyanobacteriota bacterium]|nr:glutamine synthetase [Cyanobacteriota bacterium]